MDPIAMKPTRINAILHELADGILIIFSVGPAVETWKCTQ